MLKMTVIVIGQKMPKWVMDAVADYSKRLKEFSQLTWVEIPLISRPKNCDLGKIMEKERQLIEHAIPKGAYTVALAIEGLSLSSPALAAKLKQLAHISSHLCFIVGGPEGLTQQTLDEVNEQWSLSPLTLPHPLVRVVLAEALYRAFAINAHHPYHK